MFSVSSGVPVGSLFSPEERGPGGGGRGRFSYGGPPFFGGGGGGGGDRVGSSRGVSFKRDRERSSPELGSFQDNPPPNRCVGVFGLSLYTTERDLKEFFGKFGPIGDVQLVYDHPVGRMRSSQVRHFLRALD